MEKKLKEICLELESVSNPKPNERVFKNLGTKKQCGLWLSYVFSEESFEFLIEVPKGTGRNEFKFPSWQGLSFRLIESILPSKGSAFICLKLESTAFKEVFIVLCSDLGWKLEFIQSAEKRKSTFVEFLDEWTEFFAKNDPHGLSEEKQQGLWGELFWLRSLLDAGIKQKVALDAWKGCERLFHDFDVFGEVVEVKTTKSKEPRKVWINNEKQLDETGLSSLHLLVLSVVASGGGGETLPEIIAFLRTEFSVNLNLKKSFEDKLKSAGYLNIQAEKYTKNFSIQNVELFEVNSNMPKINKMPPGIGDLKYSLLISNCKSCQVNEQKYLSNLKSNYNAK